MPDISTRINALIAYLFLGPLFLLTKEGTPLWHPFVRWHAKRASLIILIGLASSVVYFFIRHTLSFTIFGITIGTVVLASIVSVTVFFLIVWAYRAYSGISASESSWRSLVIPENSTQEWEYSEELKVRIIASFIPFVGILIASRYPIRETIIWRKIGNIFAFFLLTSVVFFSGNVTTFTLILTLSYIALIVFTAVQMFVFSRFFEFTFYKNIPTYLEFDAYIKAFLVSGFDFFKVAFGSEKKSTYTERYEYFLKKNEFEYKTEIVYFAPKWVLFVPWINLITLPSFWQQKYVEYKGLILQWLLITILFIVIVWFYGISSEIWLYLLFSILTLITSSENMNTRAPLTSVMVDFLNMFQQGKEKINEIKKKEEKIGFKYEVTEEDANESK